MCVCVCVCVCLRRLVVIKCIFTTHVRHMAPPLSPTLTSLHLRHSSSSNPSAALPTSQLNPQTFRCFTYVIGISPTSQLIFQPFRRFIYATAHSTTLPPLHLRHRSFYNSYIASPTSQALHVLDLESPPCIER